MGKWKVSENQTNRIAKARPNSSRVIISVYIESTRKRLYEKTDNTTNQNKSNLISKKPQSTKASYYNRRAELLAYTRELRHAGAQQVHWPRKSSGPKAKKWKWSSASVKIRALFQRKQERWRYERIASEEDDRNNMASASNISSFCKKFKCMLKDLSCGLQCNKD